MKSPVFDGGWWMLIPLLVFALIGFAAYRKRLGARSNDRDHEPQEKSKASEKHHGGSDSHGHHGHGGGILRKVIGLFAFLFVLWVVYMVILGGWVTAPFEFGFNVLGNPKHPAQVVRRSATPAGYTGSNRYADIVANRCASVPLRAITLSEPDRWSDSYDVPIGCVAKIDTTLDGIRLQCKDVGGGFSGSCDKYTEIQFQLKEPGPAKKIQLWFEPIGTN